MKTLTDQAKGIVEHLGKAFLISGYLPAALFFLVHQLVLFPLWMGNPLNLFGASATSTEEVGQTLTGLWAVISDALNWLVLPLLLGMLLLALNTFIISLYEGRFRWQQESYLEDAWKENKERSQKLYGDLLTLKDRYSQALLRMDEVELESEEWTKTKLRMEQLQLQIQEYHHEIDTIEPKQTLPMRPEMVTPTALGNAWSLLEEYPYDRYGMDAMIFWPRLRGEVDDSFDRRLTNQKTLIDFLLNTSFLMSILGIEVLITGLVILFGGIEVDWTWVGVTAFFGSVLLCWVIAYLAYQAAVSSTRTLGALTNACWDFFREALAKKYGLIKPDSLLDEQRMWLRLGQFLRTGEGFYFPHEHRQKTVEKEEAKKKDV